MQFFLTRSGHSIGRRRCLSSLLSLGFAVGMGHAGPAVSAEEAKPLGQITENLRITGDFRARYEAWDFFEPAGQTNANNDYDFWGLRGRLGVLLTTPYVDGFVQGQYSGIYDLPGNAIAAAPAGALGLGATYFSDNRKHSADNVFLKQAYLNFKLAPLDLPGLFLKVGRFELLEGLEYKTGDAKFDALKLTRISQRLVGAFDYTHVTRSFDGFSVVYDQPAYNITVSGTHPTQGGFNVDAQDEISDIDLFYTALTGKKDAFLPGTESRLFYLYYGDDRSSQVVDNRPAAQRLRLNQPGQDLKIHNVGTHWLTVQKLGPGAIDALLWGVYQFGDWARLDHQAWAVDAEAGYQWTDLPLKPWLRAGYFRSSGDDNANDGRHETFFHVMPTARLYAKLPFFNMMNLQDAFAQAILSPLPTVKVGIDFHHLSMAESSDLFYAGGGATSRSGSFGYLGRNAGGARTIGELVDISFSHSITKELSWSFYYGHAFGGNVTKTVYQDKKHADYGFVEVNLAF